MGGNVVADRGVARLPDSSRRRSRLDYTLVIALLWIARCDDATTASLCATARACVRERTPQWEARCRERRRRRRCTAVTNLPDPAAVPAPNSGVDSLELEFEAALGSLVAVVPPLEDGSQAPRIHVGLRRAGEGDADWIIAWLAHRLVDGRLHADLGALAPGDYEVRVWRGESEAWTAKATVHAGRTELVELRAP